MFEATIPLLFVGLHAVAYSGIGAWIFLDPYFYLGLEQLLIDIRVSPKPPFGDYGFHAFRNLGWRVLVAAILLLLAIVSGAVLIVWSIAHWHDAIRSGLICWVVIVASWLLLYGTHKQIYGAGTVRRVRRIVPVARQVASQLHESWPDADGSLPWVGRFSVDNKAPNMLMVRDTHSRFPVQETCGIFIRRDEGVLRFDLASRADIGMTLEFFFDGGGPRSFADVFDGFGIDRTLKSSFQLGSGVWLAWYDGEFSNMDERSADIMCGVITTMAEEMSKHGGCRCSANRHS